MWLFSGGGGGGRMMSREFRLGFRLEFKVGGGGGVQRMFRWGQRGLRGELWGGGLSESSKGCLSGGFEEGEGEEGRRGVALKKRTKNKS